MHRSKCASFDHIVGAPEEGERELTPSALAADGKRHADRFEKFKRLSRLNENIGKTDQEIWEMVA
jgi:hypothetical protein